MFLTRYYSISVLWDSFDALNTSKIFDALNSLRHYCRAKLVVVLGRGDTPSSLQKCVSLYQSMHIQHLKWKRIRSRIISDMSNFGDVASGSSHPNKSSVEGEFEEDAAELQFPEEFAEAETLLISEVYTLLKHRESQSEHDEEFQIPSEVFSKTLAYTERFSRFKVTNHTPNVFFFTL